MIQIDKTKIIFLLRKSSKAFITITVCICVFIAFKTGHRELVNNVIMKQEQALPDTQDQEQTKWMAYYERLLNDSRFRYTPYNLNDHHCKEQMYRNLKDNMKTVLNYPVINEMKRQYNDIYKTFLDPVDTYDSNYPVIVTASSSNRFTRSLAMISSVKKNLLPFYKGIKFIYFDLGLSKDELSIVKAFCNCEVRPFPFHLYPPFVSHVFNYAWKPIIIYNMLTEFNFVIWVDASWAFNGNIEATDNFFIKAKETGILVLRFLDSNESVLYNREETFQYLNETPCLFHLSQIETNFITIWKTPFTWKYIVQPWLACSLTENCMSHPKAVLPCRSKNLYHWCHRFDRFIFTIILHRLFNTNIDIINLNNLPAIGRIDRNQQISLQTISNFFYT